MTTPGLLLEWGLHQGIRTAPTHQVAADPYTACDSGGGGVSSAGRSQGPSNCFVPIPLPLQPHGQFRAPCSEFY